MNIKCFMNTFIRNKIEPDQVAFIEDNSARLVQFGEAFLKIFSQPSMDKEINEIFSYEPKMEEALGKSSKPSSSPPPVVTTNRFGRRISRPISIEEYDDQNETETYFVKCHIAATTERISRKHTREGTNTVTK